MAVGCIIDNLADVHGTTFPEIQGSDRKRPTRFDRINVDVERIPIHVFHTGATIKLILHQST